MSFWLTLIMLPILAVGPAGGSRAVGNPPSVESSALMAAVRANDAKAVSAALKRGADPNASDADGDYVLILASGQSSTEVVKLLVRSGAHVNYRPRNSGVNALARAVQEHRSGNIAYLLEAHATPNITCYMPPLCQAALDGDMALIRALVRHGAQIDWPDDSGETALMYSVEHVAAMKLLIGMGADVNHRDEMGWTPLVHAAESVQVQACRVLLASGATVDACAKSGRSALMTVAQSQRLGTVAELLREGANPNLRDRQGNTAFMLLCGAGDDDVILLDDGRYVARTAALMVAYGAQINLRNDKGVTALTLAQRKNYPYLIEYLALVGAVQ